MAIDFPSTPSLDYVHVDPISAKSWKWDGEKWVNVTGITASDIPDSSITNSKLSDSSITSSKLNVASSGSTGQVLTRNTGVTSGFEWTSVSAPTYSWTTYTPTWTQSATITKTVNWARYVQIGKLVTGSIKMTSSSAGTSANKIIVGLPVTASTNNFQLGTAMYTVSTTGMYPLHVLYESTTTMAFLASYSSTAPTTTTRFGTGSSGANATTIASGDTINIQFSYEAA